MYAPFTTPVPVPDQRSYVPALNAYMSTGPSAMDTALEYTPDCGPLAIDTETAGLAAQAFTIKCVTMAWVNHSGDMESVLLDPRDPVQLSVVARVVSSAPEIVLHNAAFDIPPLVHHGMMTYDDVHRVVDTIVLARMAFPDPFVVRKGLTDLAVAVLRMPAPRGKMPDAFKAAGFKKAEDGWHGMDIDAFIYRHGAMADTVVTLRLLNPLREACLSQLLEGHQFGDLGVDRSEAHRLIEREQIVNRVMLLRSAMGLAVDETYLSRYAEQHAAALANESNVLEQKGIRPGNGADLVEYLDRRGELPDSWPRTPGGKLAANKAAMEGLEKMEHPLAVAHRTVQTLTKVNGYLEKVSEFVAVTGRLHNTVNVLGASATGRMSYSDPELQQFPADARPIIVAEDGRGLTSIDWSSIEPVIMANCAGDTKFLESFNSGGDLYAPIVEISGVSRKQSKVVLLGDMYGQGPGSLAESLGVTIGDAQDMKRRVMQAMPVTSNYMDQIKEFGNRTGKAITISGRVLDIPRAVEGNRFSGYKSVNFVGQGSAYDVLSETILEMYRRGIYRGLHLAMHDEVVVDSQIAEEVRSIMETPPPALVRWSQIRAKGNVPILRTDMNHMGRTWLYV